MVRLHLDKRASYMLDLAYQTGLESGQSLSYRMLEILLGDMDVATEIGTHRMRAKDILGGLLQAKRELPSVDILVQSREEDYVAQVDSMISMSSRHATMYGRTKVTPIDLLAAATYMAPAEKKAAKIPLGSADQQLLHLREILFGQATNVEMLAQNDNPASPSRALTYRKAKTPLEHGVSEEDLKAFQELGDFVSPDRTVPFFGRENEVYRVEKILGLRRKPNAILIGDGGVGKTAIIEELAAQGKYLVFSVDVNRLVEGTNFRGDFEKKMKSLIQLGERYNSKVVLFIDEIHTIIGAGMASGSPLDASNTLKKPLARGSLKLVGCTTYVEFRKYIEKNPAFDRRFTKVIVDEPGRDDAIKILGASHDDLAEHHDVFFHKDCFPLTYDLATRFLKPKKMPDVGFDVLDLAAHWAQERNGNQGKALVTPSDISRAVSELGNIPEATMSKSDRDKVITLERELKSEIFGQNAAIEKVAQRTANAIALPNEYCVRDSMLFTGPTGVGKTEVAKLMARNLGLNFVRFDMSEFMERHSISRLIGAPPGYVGYDQGGLLATEIKKKPYSLVLLDEIEKGHPDIYNILLQILSNGSFTDGQGNNVDCQNIILILSTNIGQGEVRSGIGFTAGENTDAPGKEFAKFFSPELRGRMGDTITFEKLDHTSMLSLTRKFLGQAAEGMARQNGIKVVFDPAVEDSVIQHGFSPVFGARPTKDYVRFKVMDTLVSGLLHDEIRRGDLVRIFTGSASNTYAWEKVANQNGVIPLGGNTGVMHLRQG